MTTPGKRIENIPSIGPNGVVPQSWYESEIKIQKISFVWGLHHFHFRQTKLLNEGGKMLRSPLFPSITESKCKWSLGVKPIYHVHDFRTMTRLFLNLDETSECKNTLATYKISFLDENNEELKAYTDNNPVQIGTQSESSRRIADFFINNDRVLSSAGKLTIYCEVTFSELEPITNNFIHRVTMKHNSNVSEFGVVGVVEDIEQLLKNEEFTDFVISVKDKHYKVHKTILVARSAFFAAMFKHENLMENQQNRIDILDFEEEVVEEMINYMYTGKSENLKMLATDLLAISDKYGFDGLKVMSENAIIKNVSVENVVSLLLLADLHRAGNLKTNAINFLVAKFAEVMKTTAWKSIAESHPQLLLEVCEAMYRQNK